MVFLIEYNKHKGRIIQFKQFQDSQRLEAQKERLKLELDLNSGNIDHEVILLEAENIKLIHKTHRRYFEDLRQIGTYPL